MIISISIPDELGLKLKTFAGTSDRSISAVARQALRQLLDAADDPLAKPASFDDIPDPRQSPQSPQRPACSRCLSLGYACSAHREESVS